VLWLAQIIVVQFEQIERPSIALTYASRETQQKYLSMCEVCGDFGSLRKDGWLKTLCGEHAKARE
jgi:hypothetical protein